MQAGTPSASRNLSQIPQGSIDVGGNLADVSLPVQLEINFNAQDLQRVCGCLCKSINVRDDGSVPAMSCFRSLEMHQIVLFESKRDTRRPRDILEFLVHDCQNPAVVLVAVGHSDEVSIVDERKGVGFDVAQYSL